MRIDLGFSWRQYKFSTATHFCAWDQWQSQGSTIYRQVFADSKFPGEGDGTPGQPAIFVEDLCKPGEGSPNGTLLYFSAIGKYTCLWCSQAPRSTMCVSSPCNTRRPNPSISYGIGSVISASPSQFSVSGGRKPS